MGDLIAIEASHYLSDIWPDPVAGTCPLLSRLKSTLFMRGSPNFSMRASVATRRAIVPQTQSRVRLAMATIATGLAGLRLAVSSFLADEGHEVPRPLPADFCKRKVAYPGRLDDLLT